MCGIYNYGREVELSPLKMCHTVKFFVKCLNSYVKSMAKPVPILRTVRSKELVHVLRINLGFRHGTASFSVLHMITLHVSILFGYILETCTTSVLQLKLYITSKLISSKQHCELQT